MIRSSSFILVASVFIASVDAQTQAPHTALHPVTAPVKDAGVYHVGLGTWTRHTNSPGPLAADVLYCNTCPTGYYATLLTKEYVADEGRIPGPQGPVNCSSVDDRSTNHGSCCGDFVRGFQIGYCSGVNGGGPGGAGPISLNIGFQAIYTACALPSPLPGAPGTFDLTGLPGAGLAPAVQGCWLVTVDLSVTSPSWAVPADGASCTWIPSGDQASSHLFGWTFQNATSVTGAGQSYVGPLIAGRGGPSAPVPTCSMVDGTRWDTLSCTGQMGGPAKWPNNLTEDGWGMDTQDRFRDDTTNASGGSLSFPGGAGCYFFGGNPFASFHLRVFGSGTCCPTCPSPDLCRPGIDFTIPTCPCTSNQPTVYGAGCNALNSVASGGGPTGGAVLSSLLDYPSLSADHLSFTVTHLPLFPSESAYLIQGTTTIPSPLTFGQGLRCVGGSLLRMQIHTALNSGTSTWPELGDHAPTIHERSAQLGTTILPGTTYAYFVQYRANNIEPGCVFPNNFNASSAKKITWAL